MGVSLSGGGVEIGRPGVVRQRRAGGGPSYEFAAGSLAGEVERLSSNGDYTLTVDGNSLPVEYTQLSGNQTYSTNTNLGSATPDERMTVVKIDGNLTIDEAVTVTTAARKLGLCLYVTGDVTINGILDMTARGGNHSASGSDIAPFDLLIVPGIGADGIVPSAGGAGGAGVGFATHGNPGTAGSSGGTGGGGSGASRGASNSAGVGAAGTLWAGGAGGGGRHTTGDPQPTAGAARGGAGGAGGGDEAGGGAGNPGGSFAASGENGNNGTGGLIVVIALGAITVGATGIVRANGSNGGGAVSSGGGASGGGSVNLYRRGTYTNSGTVQANGGSGGTGVFNGGDGGAGSVRAVEI